MPAHSHQAETTAPPNRRTLLIVVGTLAFTLTAVAILVGGLFADRSRSHFVWVVLGGMAWTQALALTLGWALWREARGLLNRVRADLQGDGDLPAMVTAIEVLAKRLGTLEERVDGAYWRGYEDALRDASPGEAKVARLPLSRPAPSV